MGNDAELISKKEVLTKYQISYGTLYRWKRQGLIPEEWFIKQSTVTGQETFFPRSLIERRITDIMERGEKSTLSELADQIQNRLPEETLVLTQPSGRKQEFKLDMIRDVELLDGNGNRASLMQLIQAQLKEWKEKENYDGR